LSVFHAFYEIELYIYKINPNINFASNGKKEIYTSN
jgi:hypothetical protein